MSSAVETLPSLQLMESKLEAFGAMERFILAHSRPHDGPPLAVLEAGCGRAWPLDLGGLDFTLTGVDMNPHSLRIRQEQHGDLDAAVCGDLRAVAFDDESFDIIYCSFVLEHIDGAEQVLDAFVRWLRPRGRLILAIPDRESVFGFLTRSSPHAAHVVYRRYLLGEATAGRPGYGPFRTFYDPVVSRRGIHEYSRRHGLVVHAEYGSSPYLARLGKLRTPVEMGSKALSRMTGGRLAADHGNMLFFIEKVPLV